ncbi:MAG: DUF58 domain-containing protein [Planctomycetota bacterium]
MQARRGAKRANRKHRRLPEPTLAGHVSLTFLVIGLPFAVSLRNNPLLLSVCALIATLFASYMLTWIAAGRLRIERRVPARVQSGEQFEVRLRVTNESRWRPAFGIGFRDALQIDEPGEVTCGPTLPMLPPGGVAEVRYEKRIHRRGVYSVAHALAATRFPLGVFEQRTLLSDPTRIVVLPPIGRLRRDARRQLSSAPERSPARSTVQHGQDEFQTLREYRAGDNPKHIHWKTSARAGKLMHRVMRDDPGEDVVVLLDPRLASHAEPRHLEAAVSCVATLLVYAQREGRRAVAFFPGGRAAHRATRGGLLRALEQLAGVGEVRTDPSEQVRAAREEGARQAVLIKAGCGIRDAQRAAGPMQLRVWDVTKPEFEGLFQRR